jgi:hypothetical protein
VPSSPQTPTDTPLQHANSPDSTPRLVCPVQVHVRVTWQAGDADAFVKEAVQLHAGGGSRYSTIMAAGGDGTLNEVAGAMLRYGAAELPMALALLPLGTGNDFAAVTGISMVSLRRWGAVVDAAVMVMVEDTGEPAPKLQPCATPAQDVQATVSQSTSVQCLDAR